MQVMACFRPVAAQIRAAEHLQEADLALESVGEGLALVGPALQRLADEVATCACTGARNNLPGSERVQRSNILLMTRSEWDALRARKQSVDYEQQLDSVLTASEVVSLGVQKDAVSGAQYAVVLWPQGQRFRMRMKLPVRTFYMWLSKSGATPTAAGGVNEYSF